MYNAQLETFLRVADAGSFSKAAELQYMVHLGLHMNMVMGAIKNAAGLAKPFKAPATALRVLAAMLCGYGIYAFIGRQIGTYMLLTH